MKKIILFVVIGVPALFLFIIIAISAVYNSVMPPIENHWSVDEEVLQACMAWRQMNHESTLPAYHACKESAEAAERRGLSRCASMLLDAGGAGGLAWCRQHEHTPKPR
jgi:hypothetical protein